MWPPAIRFPSAGCCGVSLILVLLVSVSSAFPTNNSAPTVLAAASAAFSSSPRTPLPLARSGMSVVSVRLASDAARAPLSTAPIVAGSGASGICNRRVRVPLALSAAANGDSDAASSGGAEKTGPAASFRHTLAILTLPQTSTDRIANDAVLETAMSRTSHRLSVVLRGTDYHQPTLSDLRSYVGEIYSSAWDCTLGYDASETTTIAGALLDVIVYPQNLPNAAPEGWISLRPDVDCVCSHDSLTGWVSDFGGAGTGAARRDVSGQGRGGLDEHVEAINADRTYRGLNTVAALHVDPWPVGAEVRDDEHVVFLEDSEEVNMQRWGRAKKHRDAHVDDGLADDSDHYDEVDGTEGGGLLGGARISEKSLYSHVAVGGTFDSMHYGHRKLLTLAVSSVRPNTGKLLIGVTEDDMLQSKSFAELIPTLEERIRGVRDFVDNLAPGIKNRVKVVPIGDSYGPPGSADTGGDFDALVLSHETLPTGLKLNEHRTKNLGMEPLMLLCTRRTEPHGMSSTALRRLRKNVRTEANMI